MTVQAALEEAMHHDTPAGVMNALIQQGVWMADEDTMTAAIHNVYCGIMADHEHPNEKDRDQARQMIAAIGKSMGPEPERHRTDGARVPLRHRVPRQAAADNALTRKRSGHRRRTRHRSTDLFTLVKFDRE